MFPNSFLQHALFSSSLLHVRIMPLTVSVAYSFHSSPLCLWACQTTLNNKGVTYSTQLSFCQTLHYGLFFYSFQPYLAFGASVFPPMCLKEWSYHTILTDVIPCMWTIGCLVSINISARTNATAEVISILEHGSWLIKKIITILLY